MNIDAIKKKIRGYRKEDFVKDLIASVSVALIAVPQSMAYASVAGVNPIHGLYTAIIPAIVAAFFGDYRFLVTGPTNPTSLIVVSVLVSYVGQPDYAQYVFALAILSGVLKLLFGIFRMGVISRYISNSVMVGFLPAIGILIISGQLGNLFGISVPRGRGIIGIISGIATGIGDLNWHTLLLGIVSILMMIAIRRISRRIPAAFIAVIFSTLLVQIAGWHEKGVALIGDSSFPVNMNLSFSLPQIPWKSYTSLFGAAFAVAFFGMVETISITKAMSHVTGDRLNPSREMVGQGLSSIIGGLFHCIPASGSSSRTTMNVSSGAKTRLGAILSGLVLFLLLSLLSSWMKLIPVAGLAGIVIVSAARLFRKEQIVKTWAYQMQSRIVLLSTFLTAMFFPLNYAIFVGVILSTLIYLHQSSHIELKYLSINDDGSVEEFPLEQVFTEESSIAVISVEGGFHFGAIADFEEKFFDLVTSGKKLIILRLRHMQFLGSTGVLALEKNVKFALQRYVDIMLCGVRPDLKDQLDKSNLAEMIGEENILLLDSHVYNSTRQALERAKKYIGE